MPSPRLLDIYSLCFMAKKIAKAYNLGGVDTPPATPSPAMPHGTSMVSTDPHHYSDVIEWNHPITDSIKIHQRSTPSHPIKIAIQLGQDCMGHGLDNSNCRQMFGVIWFLLLNLNFACGSI